MLKITITKNIPDDWGILPEDLASYPDAMLIEYAREDLADFLDGVGWVIERIGMPSAPTAVEPSLDDGIGAE